MERAMRIYNGKPMVNSVSGKQESMDMVFPLIQKYGGVVIGLALDEQGIPGHSRGAGGDCRKDYPGGSEIRNPAPKILSLMC